MAMTKKEREAVEALQTEMALRWPRYEAPKRIPAPKWGEGKLVAWTFNQHAGYADQGCSEGGNHAVGRTDKTTSQNASPREGWYATELDALKAMRIAMSETFAEKLARVDRRIAELSAEAAP